MSGWPLESGKSLETVARGWVTRKGTGGISMMLFCLSAARILCAWSGDDRRTRIISRRDQTLPARMLNGQRIVLAASGWPQTGVRSRASDSTASCPVCARHRVTADQVPT